MIKEIIEGTVAGALIFHSSPVNPFSRCKIDTTFDTSKFGLQVSATLKCGDRSVFGHYTYSKNGWTYTGVGYADPTVEEKLHIQSHFPTAFNPSVEGYSLSMSGTEYDKTVDSISQDIGVGLRWEKEKEQAVFKFHKRSGMVEESKRWIIYEGNRK